MTVAPDPAEITPPTDPAAYARPRGMGRLAFGVMAVLCVISLIGGVAIARYMPRLFARPADAAATVAPAGPAASAPAPPSGPGVASTASNVAATPSEEIAALQARVTALENGQTRTINAAAAALAAASLAEATQGSAPFETELAALERVLPLSSEVRSLRQYAETGVPSRVALAAEFDAAAAGAAVAARDPGERAGLFARLAHALSSVVVIRRVGPGGDGADAVLARAEDSARSGDIAGAVRTLRDLSPKAAQAMAGWRARAQQRVFVDQQVAAIRAQALADLMAVSRDRP